MSVLSTVSVAVQRIELSCFYHAMKQRKSPESIFTITFILVEFSFKKCQSEHFVT